MDMKISPSMLACDFANMGAEANKCAAGGAHLLHPVSYTHLTLPTN